MTRSSMATHFFSIAGHCVCLRFAPGQSNSLALLPSFPVFSVQEETLGDVLFTMTIDDGLQPSKERKLVRKFDTGNGDTLVFQLPDGGYEYIIRNINGDDCCLLQCDRLFKNCRCALAGPYTNRSFGLNNALMLAYAFAGSHFDTLLIHASAIMVSATGTAYPFIANSGTGKSTHTGLWLRYIEGCELLNDDNPVVRIVNGQPFIYGSPWSGKTPCYRNRSAKLGAVTRIERAPANSIERLGSVAAFASLLPACSSMKWDNTIYGQLCTTITHIIETTPIFTLHCLPDEEAALLCHKTLTTS